MDIIENKTDRELLESLLASVAKAQNELRGAENDLQKAMRRNQFNIMLINKLIERDKD